MSELTIHEIEAILDAAWERTGELDPWANGVMDAELKDVTEYEARSTIVDRHQWRHDLAVGARCAIDTLRYRFREATGTPDPVSEVFRKSYEQLNAYLDAGGKVSDLTLGPIEVVSNRLPPEAG